MKQKLIDSNNIEYHKVWIETSIEGQHDGCIMAYKNQIDSLPTVEAIPVEWLKNELIPKAEKLGATTYVDNIKFVLEDWEAWKKYR